MTIRKKYSILIVVFPETVRIMTDNPEIQGSENVSHAERASGMAGIGQGKHSYDVPAYLPGHGFKIIDRGKFEQLAFPVCRIKC
jgi:hypothetical protein